MISEDRASAAYDCQACGACCSSPWQGHGYVALSPLDVLRVRAAGAITLTLRQGSGAGAGELVEKLATRRDAEGRFVCAQLDGSAGGGACRCRIYDSRPEPCRLFEPGGAACLEARDRFALPRL